ncbi:MAG: deoxyribonuclease V [Dehalococcoidia bacterium]|nr:deoxyribonuclease V [Dehalococcoidia bacterium]
MTLVNRLHDWSVTPAEAIKIQTRLAAKVDTHAHIGDVRTIAGADISAEGPDGLVRAAIVIIRYPNMDVIETIVASEKTAFPYIPGLLSFRECPPILAAWSRLRHEPDLVVVDGQGIAHPRKLGLASHLGLIWGKPTIGCAKSRLCGEHAEVPPEKGSYRELIFRGEIVGAVLRTRHNVRPVYVSVGHRIDLVSAIQWTLNCCTRARLPEPVRLAHMAASRANNLSQPGPNPGKINV